MATDAENLQTARTNLIAKLLEISANPKPSYNVDGVSVSHGDYVKMLTDSIADLNQLINAMDPYFIVSAVM